MNSSWKKYGRWDPNTHMKNKSMWTGSKSKTVSKEFILSNNGDNKFINSKITYSPTLKQLITEIIANVIDLRDENIAMYVNFYDNGLVDIRNTGNGIPVIIHPEEEMYIPELICEPFSGSNLDTDENHVSSGTNGLGIKIVISHSKYFELVTSDIINKKLFIIKFYNNRDKKAPIEVHDFKDLTDETLKTGFVRIRFLPDYELLDYKPLLSNDIDLLNKMILTQLIFSKLYQPQLQIYYNNNEVAINSKIFTDKNGILAYNKHLKFFSQLIFNVNEKEKEEIFYFSFPHKTKSKLNGKSLNFDIKISVSINREGNESNQIVIMNGIYVSKKGNIGTLVNDFFKNNLKSKVAKTTKNDSTRSNNTILLSHLNIIIVVDVPNVHMEASSQIKDDITIKKDYISEYDVPNIENLPKNDKIRKSLNKIWKLIKELIDIKSTKRLEPSKLSIPSKIYTKADKCNSSESSKCILYVPEGKTGETLIRNIIPDFRYNGIYILTGVISNSLKKSKKVTDSETEKESYLPDKSLLKDERLQGLIQVIGLKTDEKYDNSDVGNNNFKKLHYGVIMIATDEDDDGVGHIFPLITLYIETYWPELLKRSFIQRITTPIKRIILNTEVQYAHDDNLIAEFNDDYQYNKWLNIEDNKKFIDNGKYKLLYYKGLGNHTEEEHILIGRDLTKYIKKVHYEDKDHCLFNLYYAKDTTKRKAELLKPVIQPDEQYITYCNHNMIIPVEYMLNVQTKKFQLITITRRMRRFIDNNNSVRTKIIYTAKKTLKKDQLLINFMGSILKETNYHHGDTSLYESIVNIARKFPGSNYIPLLNGLGNYGNRINKDNASPARYLRISKNKIINKIFPKEDDELLDYTYEDKYIEPKYYVPIIPLAILESFSVVGTGWNTKAHARDINNVVSNIINKIKDKELCPLPLSTRLFKGKIKKFQGKDYMVGNYKYDVNKPNMIIVEELPLGVYVDTYIDNLSKLTISGQNVIKSIKNHSKNDVIKIKIKLQQNLDKYVTFDFWNNPNNNDLLDPIEKLLKIYKSTTSILNLVGLDDNIIEYDSYQEVFDDWFEQRKNFYIKRIERKIIKLRAEKVMYDNIYLFLQEDISQMKKPKKEQIIFLEKQNYVKINNVKLHNTTYIFDNKDVWDNIFNINADYKYILDIKVGKFSDEYKLKIYNKIKDLEKIIGDLENKKWINFPGDEIWIRELKDLYEIINKGLSTNWTFRNKKTT
jgi:DNA topoisomerase-2